MFQTAGTALLEALDASTFTRDELVELLALRDQLEARFARAVGAFDQSADWALDGAVSPTQWLITHARMAPDDARRLLVLGAAARQLPVSFAAVADGLLSVAQARQVTGHVSDDTVDLFAQHEAELVPALAAVAAKQVGWLMDHWQQRAITELGLEQVDGLPERNLHLSPVGRRWRLDGDFDTEGGAIIDAAIRHAMTKDVDGEPTRTPSGRRGDALVDVCRAHLDHHNDNAIARRRTHLDVIVTTDALQQGQAAELIDGTVVDAVTVARLACDADVHRVVMDATSTVLDYGRRARIVPNGLRAALNIRDRHCRYPGCDRPPAWCEAHHIVDWHHGGHTRPDNLVLLCSRHHHIVHLDGWKHVLHPDNTFEVLTPDGRTLTSELAARPPP